MSGVMQKFGIFEFANSIPGGFETSLCVIAVCKYRYINQQRGSLKNSSHKSKSQFCKVGEFPRQERYGFTNILVHTQSPSLDHLPGAGAVVSGPARTDRRRAGGAGPRGLGSGGCTLPLSRLASAGEPAYATGVKRRCRTHDVVTMTLEKCSVRWHDGP